MLRGFHIFGIALVVALSGVLVSAQQFTLPKPLPAVPPPAKADEDVEVLARGQLHEAFATSGELPAPSPVIDKRPPDPVEELPPDQKPEGDNVLWIPGYWDWDEEDKEFTWISGFWRNAPAGRVWVPGDWREVKGGWQWVPGFWNEVAPQQAQPAQLEYLPPPPALIEQGPSVAAPADDCFYTPGCWVYRVNRYVWRPGFWVRHRPEWAWVPDHYRWTPCGYVFVPGYWDCPLHTRGVLFAPVRFRAAVLARPRFVYTPVYVVPDTSLHTCLFVRTGRVNYYFGDYFEQRYVTLGFNSWSGVTVRRTEVITRTSYDPLWSYYSVAYRDTPQWQTNVTTVYTGRFRGEVPRPPRTLVQQNTVINNVTNVTNTTVVVNNPPAQSVVAPLAQLPQVSSQPIALAKVNADDRVREQKQATEIRQIAAERRKVETALVDKGQAVTKADAKPLQAKLEVPQAVTTRVQERAKAVKQENAPPPAATAAKKPDPKDPRVDPAPPAKPAVKLPPPPAIDPKTGAVRPKKADAPKPTELPAPTPGDPARPLGKPTDSPKPADPPKPPVKPTDPTKPGDPKPTDPPKVDPPKPPVTPPKPAVSPPKPPVTPLKPVDPTKPPVIPPTDPKPKDPPKPPVTPPAEPKTKDPPKPVDPPKPKDPPRVDPLAPKPSVTPLPVTDPKPKAPPKPVDPPKPPVTPPPPKVTPPKPPVTPLALPPKTDPPKPPATPPAPPPKVDPPKRPLSPPPKRPATTPTKSKEEKPKDKG